MLNHLRGENLLFLDVTMTDESSTMNLNGVVAKLMNTLIAIYWMLLESFKHLLVYKYGHLLYQYFKRPCSFSQNVVAIPLPLMFGRTDRFTSDLAPTL